MGMYQAFKMALENIISNKMRTFLTMLGMIIGVASVIVLVSLMQGLISFTKKQFADMGSNRITISLLAKSDKKPMREEEMYQFYEEHKDLFQSMTPQVLYSTTLRNGKNKLEARNATGINESYATIANLKIERGRFLAYSDVETRKNVCVIGSYTNKKLFGGEEAIGKMLHIGEGSYEVIGVLKEKNDSEVGSDDDVVYVPYTTLSKRSFQGKINTYILTGRTEETTKEGKRVVEKFLFDRYHTDEAYTIFSLLDMLKAIDQQAGLMTKMLVGIASISLLVAGIGIMNIMLVSVTERTKEIGIRKALGARRKDIMRQFVFEAGMVSSLGGILGIFLGGSATTMLGKAFNIDTVPSTTAIIVSFSVSAGIGIIFGYLPANKAAKLNPIDALRNE